MKKVLSILLIVCLAFSSLVACGKKDNKKKETTKPSVTNSASAVPSATAPTSEDPSVSDENPNVSDETPSTSDEAPGASDEIPSESATTVPTATPGSNTSSEWATGTEMDFDPSINESIECIAFDFRGGESADMELLDSKYGFEYLNSSFFNCDVWGEKGALQAKIDGDDPYFYFYGFEEFQLQDYPVFKIVLKNQTTINVFEMFLFEQGDSDTVMGQKVIQKSGLTKLDTAWKTYTMNFTGSGDGSFYTPSSLDRTISGIRIDCISTGLPGTVTIGDDWHMEIAYFGFFKTVEDADAYK